MKVGLKKLWSWILVLAMAINLIPAQAIEIDSPESQNTYSEGGDQSQSGTEAVADGLLDFGTISILMENVEKRTEFSKEFKLTNGFNMAVVYPEAVHYEKMDDGKISITHCIVLDLVALLYSRQPLGPGLQNFLNRFRKVRRSRLVKVDIMSALRW